MDPPQSSSNQREPKPEATERELLSWARRRGLVSLLFFVVVATAISVWALTR